MPRPATHPVALQAVGPVSDSRWERNRHRFLYERLIASDSEADLLHAHGNDDEIMAMLAEGCRSAGVPGQFRELLETMEDLPITSFGRGLLIDGLDAFQAGRWDVAITLLLVGFEGALLGLYRAEHPTQRISKSAEAILKQLPLPDDAHHFLMGVYGAQGNDFRHGEGHGDAQAHAMRVLAGTAWWLDRARDESSSGELLVETARRQLFADAA